MINQWNCTMTLLKNIQCILLVTCLLFLEIRGNSSVAQSVAIDNNNKLVVGGFFDNGTNTDFALARYNPDGSLDTTFNENGPQPGIVVTDILGGNDEINAVVIDNNNNIVVAGSSESFIDNINGTAELSITVARYTPAGTLDTSFGVNGIVRTTISGVEDVGQSMVIDNNNKIVVAGYSNDGLVTSIAVVRYNGDGTLDTSFGNAESGIPGIVLTRVAGGNTFINDDRANSVVIDNNNKIVIAGSTDNGIDNDIVVVRYNEDGSLDETFNSPVPLNPLSTTTSLASPADLNTVNIPSSRSVRPGVVVTSVFADDTAYDLKIDNNNKIVVVGSTTNNVPFNLLATQEISTAISDSQFLNNQAADTDWVLIRYNDDGSLDTTLNPLAGLPPATTLAVIRVPAPGIVVTTISQNDDVARSVVIDNNNNMVVTGFSTVIANNSTNHAFTTARYTPTGLLDTTFNPMGTIPGIIINNISTNAALLAATAVPPALTASGFSIPSLTSTNIVNGAVVRSANDSAVVNSLNNNEANWVVIDNNNNIVVTGFSSDGIQNNFTTVRYTPAGALDSSFESDGIVITQITNGIPPVTPIFGAEELLDSVNLNPTLVARLSAPLGVAALPVITAPLTDTITNDVRPVITGTAISNATITLLVNGVPLDLVTADDQGNWTSLLPPLLDGTYTIIVQAADSLGTLSFPSMPIRLTIDTQVPVPPVIVAPKSQSFIGSGQVTLEGTAKPNSIVVLYSNNTPIGQVSVNSQGTWSYKLDGLADGMYMLYAVAADLAGNVSMPSDLLTFVVDTRPPRAPRIISPANNTITISQVTIIGDAKPYVPVIILLDGKSVTTVNADINGQWSVVLSSLVDGIHKVRALVTDPVAQIQHSSPTLVFTVDNQAPAPAEIMGLEAETQGHPALVKGKAEPHSTVTIFIDGKRQLDSKVNAHGLWSYSMPKTQQLTPGNHRLEVMVTDKAGNSSSVISYAFTT